MSKEKQINKIINIMFYKGVRDIVKDFLFINCVECNKKILEENSFEFFDGKYICKDCVTYRVIRICYKCKKYYNLDESTNDCEICDKSCLIDCDNCYNKSNHKYLIYDSRHYNAFWMNTYPYSDH